MPPGQAWVSATSNIFGAGSPGQKKNCPKGAFLGLCEDGYITGIPPGNYTSSTKNKAYAIDAVRILRVRPELESEPRKLWTQVDKDDPNKSHNSQMNVVVALWSAELIRRPPAEPPEPNNSAPPTTLVAHATAVSVVSQPNRVRLRSAQ